MTPPRDKGGRPSGKHLTPTDIATLQQIANEGFQTHQELRNGSLKERGRCHSWVVMKRLVQLGFLQECMGDGGGIRGWALSIKGQRSLQGQVADDWMTSRRPPSYKTSYEHDVVVREIKNVLCLSPSVSNWIPEHVLRSKAMSQLKYMGERARSERLALVPDAAFRVQHRGKTFKAALELEFTRRSKSRLFQKLEAHIASSDSDFSFFVVNGAPLFDAIWRIYHDVLANSVKAKLKNPQNGIYFSELSVLRANALNAKFKGLRDSICFGELRP